MELNFDVIELTLRCPHCGGEIKERLGRFKDNNPVACPTCQKPVRVDASEFIRTATEEVSRGVADLSAEVKGLGDIGKR